MTSEPTYVLGHGEQEIARLELQATLFEDITRRILQAAGLQPGMRVLDVGCGAGDLSFLAAGLVGPNGDVVGIDREPDAIEIARARAAALLCRNATFRIGSVDDVPQEHDYDAAIGRFVLMHQREPSDLLRRVARRVRPGGIVAFMESQLDASVAGVHSWPLSPLYDRIMHMIARVLRAAGAHTDMGLRMRPAFIGAGLPAPELHLEARVDGGRDSPIYRYAAENVRIMQPAAQRFGLMDLADQDVERLAEELEHEVTAANGVLMSPLLVGAWCRTPSA